MVIQPGAGFSIGATCLRLNFLERIIIEEPDSRYLPFLTPCEQFPDDHWVDIDIRIGGIPSADSYVQVFDTGEGWTLFSRGDERCIMLRHRVTREPLWCAVFPAEPSRIAIHCAESMVSSRNGKSVLQNPVTYPLDLLLLMYVLARRKGLMIHCGGVNMGGAGLLFAGRSGAGKSTIVKCLASVSGVEALSDDRVVVRKVACGFRMFGTPWLGTAGIGVNRNVPLKGVFFLGKGNANEIRKLDAKSALEKLLPVASVPWFDKAVVPVLLELCGDVVARIPAYDLQFYPGSDVVRTLASHVETMDHS